MRKLSTSGVRAFHTCPRFYKHRYIDGYDPLIKAETLLFGSLLHNALEHWWKLHYLDDFERLNTVIKFIDEGCTDDFERVKAIAMITGYHHRWSDQLIEPIAIETPFTTDIVNPDTGASSRTWLLTGKIDAIVEFQGAAWLMEHKTSSDDIRAGTVYWQKLRIDNQISNYYRGAEVLGHKIEGCIYDVLKKPMIRPAKATPEDKRKYKKDGSLYASMREYDELPTAYVERLTNHIADNPDIYFQRGEVFRLADEEKEASFDLWQAAKSIRDSELADRWPRNTGSCFKWQRACEYWPVCSGECSLDDTHRFVKREEKNESDTDTNTSAAV